MKKILGASIGCCVHVAGIMNFLGIAKLAGFQTKFIGSAVDINLLKQEIERNKPDIIGVSYRLSPESAAELFTQFEKIVANDFKETIFILGTTKAVSDYLANKDLLRAFDRVFTGGENVLR